ncbi:MAG: FAD-dependent oxidoreductase [Oscillospiraceae bacterium]
MIYDSIIIGAGPAGLSAAINLNGRGKEVLVLNGGDNLLTKAGEVTNYLGFPHISGSEMMSTFKSHVTERNIAIDNKKSANIMPSGNSFYVNVEGDILESKSIILATGVFKAQPVENEDKLLGRGVSYCATCDGMLFRNKNVIVWGLADNAPEEAAFLKSIGVNVTFVGAKENDVITQNEIPFIKGSLKAVNGENKVSGATLSNGDVLPCDGIFILRNSIAPDKLIPSLALENGYITVDRKMQTNIKGVFACGDCTGLPLQVSKAVGEGLISALACSEYLDIQ